MEPRKTIYVDGHSGHNKYYVENLGMVKLQHCFRIYLGFDIFLTAGNIFLVSDNPTCIQGLVVHEQAVHSNSVIQVS